MMDQGQMTNWMSSLDSPRSRTSRPLSTSSFESMMSPNAFEELTRNIDVSEASVLAKARRMLNATSMCITSSLAKIAKSGVEGPTSEVVTRAFTSQAGLGKTTLYFLFWYLCTLCNDQ